MTTSKQSKEWILANQFGSFATGSEDRLLRRKYHSLLTVRNVLPGETLNLIAEAIEEFDIHGEPLRLIDFDFSPPASGLEVVGEEASKGRRHLVGVESAADSVTWTYQIGDIEIIRRLTLESDPEAAVLSYRIQSPVAFPFRWSPVVLCRPWHHLAAANPVLNGQMQSLTIAPGQSWQLSPYRANPAIQFTFQGRAPFHYRSAGDWYCQLRHCIEEDRGYPAHEDVYIPGWFETSIEVGVTEFEIAIVCGNQDGRVSPREAKPVAKKAKEAPSFEAQLFERSGQFLMQGRNGLPGIVAGYPWFEVWARDTFISLPGLCYWSGRTAAVKKRQDFAVDLLKLWGQHLVRGDLASHGLNATGMDVPLFYLRALKMLNSDLPSVWKKHESEWIQIFEGLIHRLMHHQYHPAVSITDLGYQVRPHDKPSGWMDAVVHGQAVTPRHGYPIDLVGLWYEVCQFYLQLKTTSEVRGLVLDWARRFEGLFAESFWLEQEGFLADVVTEHGLDRSLRPNQLWALVGAGSLLTDEKKGRALEVIRLELLTAKGLRTLSPRDSRFVSHYAGDQETRDHSYHQGTVWPWLLGIYVEASQQILGTTVTAEDVVPTMDSLLEEFLTGACPGQIAEVFDGGHPGRGKGTPAQAWSLSEWIRARRILGIN